MGEEGTTRRIYEVRATGKRQRGIPRKEWNCAIRAEAEKRGCTWEDVREMTGNRERWREFYRNSVLYRDVMIMNALHRKA